MAANLEAQGLSVIGEGLVELTRRDIATFKMGPSVVVGIRSVDPTDGVQGESLLAFKAVESLKWATQDHPSEVPENSEDIGRGSHSKDRTAIPTVGPYWWFTRCHYVR